MSNRGSVPVSPAPFEAIAELFERSLSIRHVYGEPIQHGDTTVVPVAKVVYGFGAGGGEGRRRMQTGEVDKEVDNAAPREGIRPEAYGAGGGGGVRMTPVGALEIGLHGTRFVRFHPLGQWFGAAALALVAGWLIARRRNGGSNRGDFG